MKGMHGLSTADAAHDGPFLQCRDLVLGYPGRDGWKAVVHGVSLEVNRGRTLALVGESGSGKSTIAKALVKLIPVRSGSIQLDGEELAPLSPSRFHPWRRRIQLVFQDPWLALNPRMQVGQLLAEPLQLHFPELSRSGRREQIDALLESVQLPKNILSRYPAEFSGGQRQRLLIARALAVDPELLVCDEPASALDVTVQGQLLDLLAALRESRNLTLVFISHDLAVVQQIADQVVVLQEGRVVESAASAELFRQPRHPYTRTLLEACPQW